MKVMESEETVACAQGRSYSGPPLFFYIVGQV